MKGILLENGKEHLDRLYEEIEKISKSLELLIENKDKQLISPEEVAEILDVTTQTIYGYIKKGIIPASKVGRKLLINRSDIEDALNGVKSLKYKRENPC